MRSTREGHRGRTQVATGCQSGATVVDSKSGGHGGTMCDYESRQQAEITDSKAIPERASTIVSAAFRRQFSCIHR